MAPLSLVAALWLAAAASHAAGVYQTPSPNWTAKLEGPVLAFKGQTGPLASIAGLSPDLRTQALAPVVYQLGRSLHMKPADFAKLDAQTQSSALALAAEEAQADLLQRSYNLVGEAKSLTWSGSGIDHKLLTDLRGVALRLQEVHKHYGPFLGEAEREAVEAASAQAAARYLEARSVFLDKFGQDTAEALTRDQKLASGSGSLAAQQIVSVPAWNFKPSKNAYKLLEDMKRNKSGWGQRDIHSIYTAFGFDFRDDGPHRVYFHPVYKHLGSEAVSRQNDLPPGYARSAISLIEQALALSNPASEPALVAKTSILADPLAELPPLPQAPAAKPKPVKAAAKVPALDLSIQPVAEEIVPEKAVAVEVKAPVPEPKAEPEPEPAPAPVAQPVRDQPAPAKKPDAGWFGWLKGLLRR